MGLPFIVTEGSQTFIVQNPGHFFLYFVTSSLFCLLQIAIAVHVLDRPNRAACRPEALKPFIVCCIAHTLHYLSPDILHCLP